jgi:N-acetylglutamate synthase-like GNAT family acetyltransferase
LCINPDQRIGGWGETIVKWLEYIAKHGGIRTIYLVPETPKLISYYKKLGFETTDATGKLMFKFL